MDPRRRRVGAARLARGRCAVLATSAEEPEQVLAFLLDAARVAGDVEGGDLRERAAELRARRRVVVVQSRWIQLPASGDVPHRQPLLESKPQEIDATTSARSAC